MPRIPTIENRASLRPLPNVQVRPSVSTGLATVGAALGNANQTIQNIRQEEQLKADRASFMEADRVLGQSENTLLHDPQNGAFMRRGKDAFDVTPSTLDQFDRAASDAERGLTSDRQRTAFRESATRRRESVQQQLQVFEGRERESFYANERDAYKRSAVDSALTNYQDPARIEDEIQRTRSVIDQTPGLSPEQRSAELVERRSGIYAGVVDRYLANEQVSGAERYYASVRDRVGGEQATNIERAIRVAKDREAAKRDSGLALAKAELQDEVRDIEAAFRLRLPVRNVPSEARFVSLYGERGRKMHEQTQLMANASVEAARLTQLPTEEVVRIASGYTPTQVEGAAAGAEVAAVIQQQARADIQERADDPAGYLLRHSPSVQATWADFSNGGDVQRYLIAVRGEQERLGLPVGDLLPNDYADAVATKISASDAEGMANMIQTEASRWGKSWPEVYGQLAPKMTDIAAVIGSGIPTYAADALASTAGLKTAELEAMIPSGTTLKDVQDQVQKTFENFTASFPVDAARTVGAFNDSAVRLSTRYMQQGNAPSDAVKKAYTDLVGSYNLINFRSVPYRVPKRVNGAPIDVSAIEDGADEMVRNFSASSSSITVPPGLGITAEEYQSDYSKFVQDHAYWMTAPDESGLRLYLEGGPVVAGNGPVQYSWQQLTERAMALRAKKKELDTKQRATAVEQSRQPGLR